jgi:hypothetical protein
VLEWLASGQFLTCSSPGRACRRKPPGWSTREHGFQADKLLASGEQQW